MYILQLSQFIYYKLLFIPLIISKYLYTISEIKQQEYYMSHIICKRLIVDSLFTAYLLFEKLMM